jgi:diguanylate cyclase (GGDEF)-like protein/PAS domain S-box-containing protein
VLSPLGAALIAVVAHFGIVARSALYTAPIAIIVGTFISTSTHFWWRDRPDSRLRFHCKVATQMSVAVAAMYLTGWGPCLAIVSVIVAQDTLSIAGAHALPIIAGWNLALVLIGEIAIALGWIPTVVPAPQVHGLAFISMLGVAAIYRTLALSLNEKDTALDLVEARERRFRSLVQNAQDLVEVVDADANLTYISPSARELLGVPDVDALIGTPASGLLHPDSVVDGRAFLALRPGEATTFALSVRTLAGEERFLEGSLTNLLDDPAVAGYVINAHDVTAHRAGEIDATRKAAEQRELVELSQLALGDVDIDSVICEATTRVSAVLGSSCVFVAPDAVADEPGTIIELPNGIQSTCGSLHIEPGRVLRDDELQFVQTVANLLSARMRREQIEREIRHQALHDSLTGLHNRTYLRGQTSAALGTPRRQAGSVALILVDLDGFKEVNDSLGHATGDHLLVALAERLTKLIREGDTVARLGGDEFAVLLHNVGSRSDAERAARRIHDALAGPVEIDGMQLSLNASLGIALAEEGHDSGTLMQHADLAMYHAKRTRTGLAFYEAAEHDEHARERLELLSQLRPAIEHGQLRVHYQPKVSLHDGDPFGVEALVRWDHPDKGLLAAGRFVDLAEHSGLMLAVTKVVLDTAVADFRAWRRAGLQLELAINLSASLLHDESVASMILRRLRAAGVPTREIVLEITETALLTAPTVARRSLEALSDAGVRVSLDDFGTGHSSLSHLRQYPISELKIDKSFVDGAVRDERDRALIRSIVGLGTHVGLSVIAEGIEHDDTRRALLDVGVTRGQGYLFAQPMSAADLTAWMERVAVPRPTGFEAASA